MQRVAFTTVHPELIATFVLFNSLVYWSKKQIFILEVWDQITTLAGLSKCLSSVLTGEFFKAQQTQIIITPVRNSH